ncbi:hypothetical protein DV515_00018673 [Chloebia gouldiae]|uniref:Uncharacterized protein n=1 Tax=Chloebia gouldiae TaxID=44316 RepID=A0A3L8Q739_CHLGU|nr:hypothetical protein DV515_00018674 [Chloebia gouldiae]RLV63048.1 hypothetical protein DV515_00018673 [Chloebia gouldiae]
MGGDTPNFGDKWSYPPNFGVPFRAAGRWKTCPPNFGVPQVEEPPQISGWRSPPDFGVPLRAAGRWRSPPDFGVPSEQPAGGGAPQISGSHRWRSPPDFGVPQVEKPPQISGCPQSSRQVEDLPPPALPAALGSRSGGSVPGAPHTLSSSKTPVSISSSCQGMGTVPEAKASHSAASPASSSTPFTVEKAPTSPRSLA